MELLGAVVLFVGEGCLAARILFVLVMRRGVRSSAIVHVFGIGVLCWQRGFIRIAIVAVQEICPTPAVAPPLAGICLRQVDK